jgi:beta-lactamase superfamily II metal-dependent hydrolase
MLLFPFLVEKLSAFDSIGLMRRLLAAFSGFLMAATLQAAQKPLQIYFVDVEGGQATLFVTPAGQSLLIDTGWAGNAFRDALRIDAAAKLAKIKKIDYVLITHYHADHVGGVPQLAAKIPVGTFIDHGPNRESGKQADRLWSDYEKAFSAAQRLTVKPGDHLPIKGIEAVVVSADGNVIDQALPGAGESNAACSGVQQQAADPTENARSLGTVITFGKLKIVDLGDLTWNKELDLVCPNNKIGKADIFIVSHHGMDISNSPALVHGIRPRVAIMDNGSKKGGKPAAWDIIKSSPGLEDLWQLHFANEGGKEHNIADAFIANVDEADTGYYLKLTANADGSFEIYNKRNKQSKQYPAK